MGRDTTQIERRFQPKVLSVSKNSSMTKSLQNNLQDFHLPEKNLAIFNLAPLHHQVGSPRLFVDDVVVPEARSNGEEGSN